MLRERVGVVVLPAVVVVGIIAVVFAVIVVIIVVVLIVVLFLMGMIFLFFMMIMMRMMMMMMMIVVMMIVMVVIVVVVVIVVGGAGGDTRELHPTSTPRCYVWLLLFGFDTNNNNDYLDFVPSRPRHTVGRHSCHYTDTSSKDAKSSSLSSEHHKQIISIYLKLMKFTLALNVSVMLICNILGDT